ncbi:putative voltage-gated potassium channel subunit beta [Thiomonas arsenitoxydans]|uniref:Voltage-gated potassium channel subunit beta n=2 Tax=Thiomonas arsenitoxydans (strain DSM 22701 / CIP 110005 / 3As) TaxID=426114 RepID=D6CSI7_THIA3|nr:Voltage-gated potassium channel subunit beta-2 (K(+) channel subunit beta-2) (Kv-beta-2) (HKvbeta2) [Thiomonas arsenitoxydans]CQR32896.1 putative voltage-gated potassium channel subunit beta [Thiomonas arsenitoxydans]CQR33161.1 putative voltage-gated potassium channel subunit beta [Thiomonas arsenitoxydans]CQR33775.1 putative voltage-gated potassium channel subunit beta [Thiomonas arsenitoxydans]CQR40156.1 putative voltage-gated potassium channel subunit beta [Thiomonas arsenitoxydans]
MHNPMLYRRLGRSGLQVSLFSLGSWVTFHNQVDASGVREMMAAARDAGINFFDNAEVYANGESERLMGEALAQLKWHRLDYVVSSKFFWGLDAGTAEKPRINGRNTLNRKYLLQAVDGSLKRMGLDFIDLIFCHRPDPHTPIEETVWALHNVIEQGKALYWGTSEWSADEIRAAYEVAERHHLHKPVMEQPQYHLFHRKRVEQEYARLYDDIGLGLTTWSPLASGLLTGKYRQGIPAGSRGAMQNVSFLRDGLLDARKNAAVGELEAIAQQLDCSVAQLALAWVAHNPRVSSVILGASKLSQLQENLGALSVLPKLTPEVLAQMDAISAPLAV